MVTTIPTPDAPKPLSDDEIEYVRELTRSEFGIFGREQAIRLLATIDSLRPQAPDDKPGDAREILARSHYEFAEPNEKLRYNWEHLTDRAPIKIRAFKYADDFLNRQAPAPENSGGIHPAGTPGKYTADDWLADALKSPVIGTYDAPGYHEPPQNSQVIRDFGAIGYWGHFRADDKTCTQHRRKTDTESVSLPVSQETPPSDACTERAEKFLAEYFPDHYTYLLTSALAALLQSMVRATPTREELTAVFNKWNADHNSEPQDLITAILAQLNGGEK